MPIFKYIFKNTVFLLIARVIFKALSAGLIIILARFFDVEKFGQYSTAIAFAGIFMVFNDLGMNAYMLREGSRDKTKLPALFGNGLLIEIVMSMILYIAIIIVSRILKYPSQVLILISLFSIATLIYEARKIFEGAFRVHLKFKIIGWQQILYSGLLLFLTILVILFWPSMKNIAYAQILVSIIIFFFYSLPLFKLLRPKFALRQIWPMLSGAFAFCLSQFFFIIYFQTDAVILSVFRGAKDVGLYSAIYKLVVAIFIFSQIVLQTCMPIIYKISLKEKEKLKRIYTTLIKYLSALGLACSVGLFFLAKPIVLLVYGKKYESAVIILQILAWFVILKFISATFSTYLLSTEKQNRRAAIQGVAAALNLGLNLLLIPKWGYIAAAATTLLSDFFLGAVYYFITTRDFKERFSFFLKAILRSLPAVITLSLFLFFTKDHLHVILTSVLGALIFGASLWIFRFFDEYDIKLIRQVMTRDTNIQKQKKQSVTARSTKS